MEQEIQSTIEQVVKDEWKDKMEWTNNDRKWLMNAIHLMSKYEQIEVFHILQKDMVKYTENQNGIFINIQQLKVPTLNTLGRFVTYANVQRVYLEERDKQQKQPIPMYEEPVCEEESNVEVEQEEVSQVEEVQEEEDDVVAVTETTEENQQHLFPPSTVKFSGFKAKILKQYKDVNRRK
jgi:Bromodomain extra-terminal - transcription regulation